MASRSAPHHVALLIETSNAYARGLLSGVWDFVSTHREWSTYLVEYGRDAKDFSWLHDWRGDGVLARIENHSTAETVRRLQVPVVDLSAGRFVPTLPGFETDDAAIAHLAIEHLVERGLAHFAFVGDTRFAWAAKRQFAFRRYVAERGGDIHELELDSAAAGPAGTRRALAEWLLGLPKPIGILACYDLAGMEVLEACKIVDIRVPDDVAVIGVDNDELFCNLATPSLTSIEPDARRTGFLAAELLQQMMTEGVTGHHGLRLVPPRQVVARGTTNVQQVQDPLVLAALSFIRENAAHNPSVDEVADNLGCSRRTLDHRFMKTIGRTTHAEITRARLDLVADMLVTTQLTLPQIATATGFRHPEYMSVLFKKHRGASPGAYRKERRESI